MRTVYRGEMGETGNGLNYGQDLGCVLAVKVLVLPVGCNEKHHSI